MAPIGAMISSAKVMDWEPGAHASTFGGNLVACAAAIEGLKILKERDLVKRAEQLGNFALKRLNEIAEESSLIGDVRGKGLLIGIELVKDKRTKERAVEEREKLVRDTLDRGLIIFRGGRSVIRIAPPLVSTRLELQMGLDIFEKSLKEIERKL
jgi:4-aminobutyrate aminotransferase